MTNIINFLTPKRTIVILVILLGLFLFRVLAQLFQYIGNISLLPGFETWHSATIPYVWLLLSQVLIIVVIISVIIRIHQQLYQFKKRRAIFLLCSGSFYFLFMLLRFMLGITVMTTHSWFGAILPALFHLVLASIIIVIGLYEYGRSSLQ